MKKTVLTLIVSFLAGFFFFNNTNAQVTTATLSGVVNNESGMPIQNANIIIEFPDAGIKQMLMSKSDGRFTMPNLRVGGPYKISVTHISHEPSAHDNVFLELGLNNTAYFTLKSTVQNMNAVTVTAVKSNLFDNKTSGASTNINSRQLKTMPSISRSADDFLRFTPSASSTYNGISFAGRNGQYNNFSLDGAIFNNPFGLDAPTPGGQTNAQPVSIDAIDQIQVNIAPYDVTQAGFTGAGVNTVTKSGSNKTTGTVYSYYRNQSMTGKKVDGNKFVIPSLSQFQGGASLGGALIKNKLFYFANIETEQRTDEASAYQALNASNAGLPNTSRVLEQDLMAVSSILKNRFGYETGPYQEYNLNQINYKWLAKIDWNINSIHKLSVTYNGLDASKEKPAHPSAIGRRGPDYTTMQFKNAGYQILNKLNSFSTELKSNWKGNYANKMRLVYTAFNDKRNPFSTPFPVVNISKYGNRYIIAGHEPFSIHNILNQKAFQATNDFTIYKAKHSITGGLSYESFKFANSFNLTGYGPAIFSDIDIRTFLDSVPVGGATIFGAYPLDVDVAYAQKRAQADKWSTYYLTVAQLSAYVQDEWQVNKKLKLTYGLRIDKSSIFNAKYESADINPNGTFSGTYTTGTPTIANNDPMVLYDANGNRITNGVGKDLDNTKLPKGTLVSPRFGFNWDVKGNRTVQVRGGSGLFTGRFPFVWIGNHIGNPFSYFYNATDSKFRWPQVWRTNIGTDLKLHSGTILTFDAAYTKDIKAMMVRNYKLGKPTGTLNSGTGDSRSIYTAANQGANNAYVFTNTNLGYQFNVSMQAQRNFKKGLYAMLAYNYLIAKDASSISAEISSDAFDRNPILNNANEAKLTTSMYGNKHRVISAVSKKYEYGKEKCMSTTLSLFGSWTSGNRYAYVYGGDINNDGTASNDLMYVPTNAEIDVMNFDPLTDVNGVSQNAAAQRAAFKSFIQQDKYLKKRRGSYTEKYDAETPWFGQVDMKILQEFKIKKTKNAIQLSLDIVNLGNLLSSKWGVKKYASSTGYYQPLAVKLTNSITPVYQFDTNTKTSFTSNPDLPSRWQMQFGVRYIF